MSENGFTQGDWKVREIPEGMFDCKSWAIDFSDDQEQIVDHVYSEADAKLISAAPNLLAALEELRDLFDQFGMLSFIDPEERSTAWNVEQAIAKARGLTR